MIKCKKIALDYILNALCSHEKLTNMFFNTEFNKFDLIKRLFNLEIETHEIECIEGHLIESYINKILRMYINIFLKRYSVLRSDFRSKNTIRKLLNFNPDADIELSEEEAN